MRAMEYLATTIGIVIGLLAFTGRRYDFLVILFYFAHIRSQESFQAFYDNADDEATFSLNDRSGLAVMTYADYLKLHKAAHETAYTRYRNIYDGLLRLTLVRTLPILVLPVLLFRSMWYLYALGILVAFVGSTLYQTFVANHKIGFYQRMLIGAILKNYQKEQQIAFR